MMNTTNPLGLDLDANGIPLQTHRNLDILNEMERRKAAAAAAYYGPAANTGYVDPHYAGGSNYGAPQYQQPRFVRTEPRVDDIYYSSAESNVSVYGAGDGRPTYDVNYGYGAPQKGGSATPDRFDTGPVKTATPNGYFKPAEQPVEKTSFSYVWVPVSGEYHYTLLPKGFEEERVVLQEQELSRKVNEKGVTVVTAIKHYKSQILNKGNNDMQNQFSEDLFKTPTAGVINLKEFEIKNYLADETTGLEYFTSGQLADLLMKHHRENTQEDAIYLLDYYNINGYFNNIGKNLFFDLNADSTTIQEATGTLSRIYEAYCRNNKTINSIKLIDDLLTKNFVEYIVGYTGMEILKNTCTSFMKQAGVIHEKASSLPDVQAQEHLKAAIQRFVSTLFRNVASVPKDLLSSCGIEPNELTIPLRELSITTTNKDILEELKSIEQETDRSFYINKKYSTALSDLLETLNKDITYENYTKVTLFTYAGLYQIVKSRDGSFYVNGLKIFN